MMTNLKFMAGTLMISVVLVLSVVVLGGVPARADFTGRSWTVKTVTGKIARKCEYRYQSKLYYEIFETYCPNSIEVY